MRELERGFSASFSSSFMAIEQSSCQLDLSRRVLFASKIKVKQQDSRLLTSTALQPGPQLAFF